MQGGGPCGWALSSDHSARGGTSASTTAVAAADFLPLLILLPLTLLLRLRPMLLRLLPLGLVLLLLLPSLQTRPSSAALSSKARSSATAAAQVTSTQWCAPGVSSPRASLVSARRSHAVSQRPSTHRRATRTRKCRCRVAARAVGPETLNTTPGRAPPLPLLLLQLPLPPPTYRRC